MASLSSSSSSSPCAACKFLRRKCTPGCVFAPYFPPDQPTKFANVHRVFGASNVSKLLNDLQPIYREDAVNSLAFEADARIRDPVYGCVGYISALQQRLKQLRKELDSARKELNSCLGNPSTQALLLPQIHDPRLQQLEHLQQQFQAQLLQQHQHEFVVFQGGYDVAGSSGGMEMVGIPHGMGVDARMQLQLAQSEDRPRKSVNNEEVLVRREGVRGDAAAAGSSSGGSAALFGSSFRV